jgi:acetoin utilization deacetylase AcuC-like enzyme
VAIIDFDVHHGNGTEAVVNNTTPAAPRFAFSTPYCDGSITAGAHSSTSQLNLSRFSH